MGNSPWGLLMGILCGVAPPGSQGVRGAAAPRRTITTHDSKKIAPYDGLVFTKNGIGKLLKIKLKTHFHAKSLCHSTLHWGHSTIHQGNSTPEPDRSSTELPRSSLERRRSRIERGRSTPERGRTSIERRRSSLDRGRSPIERRRSRPERPRSPRDRSRPTLIN